MAILRIINSCSEFLIARILYVYGMHPSCTGGLMHSYCSLDFLLRIVFTCNHTQFGAGLGAQIDNLVVSAVYIGELLVE